MLNLRARFSVFYNENSTTPFSRCPSSLLGDTIYLEPAVTWHRSNGSTKWLAVYGHTSFAKQFYSSQLLKPSKTGAEVDIVPVAVQILDTALENPTISNIDSVNSIAPSAVRLSMDEAVQDTPKPRLTGLALCPY